MDIFSQIVRDFSALPGMESWDEAQKIFQHAASGRPDHWLLPVRACEAVGGLTEQVVPVVVAAACAHIGILLVDDMLDDDPRGDYHRMGMPAVSNMACAFQAASLQAVAQGIQQPSARLAALTSFNEMFLSTAFGQFLDVQIPVDEDAYWRTTQAKSSPFFGAALQMGALVGGGTLEIAGQLKALGHLYGEMIQIHDDMHDSMEVPANPDWIQKRKPLPILFAQTVDHPSRSRFMELCDDASNPKSLEEAQEILIQCGAFSYCVDQLLSRYQTVRGVLSTIPLERPSVLSALFEGVVAPVWKLFKATAEN